MGRKGRLAAQSFPSGKRHFAFQLARQLFLVLLPLLLCLPTVASGEAEVSLPVVWYSRDPPLAILRG